VLILVFGVMMPVLRRLSAVGSDSRALVAVGGGTDMQYADLQADGSTRMRDDSVTLSGGDELLLPGPSEYNYEQQLNAIKVLVAEDPARVAQVVKNWIINDV
jgi:flagellar M-ring protein FliF